jgi:hypothetical protein
MKTPNLRNASPPSGSSSNSTNSGHAKPTKAWNSKNKTVVHETGTPPRGKVGGLPSR